MQITVTSTGRFFQMDEVCVRAWTGTDAAGAPVVALILAVTAPNGAVELVPMPPADPSWSAGVSRHMGEMWRLAGQLTEADMRALVQCAYAMVRGNR